MRKNVLLSLLSGLLLALPFGKYNLWFLAWFGFVPLFLALQGKSKAQAFWLAYLTGIIFWTGTIYWLIHVTLPGTIILILYLALFFSFFGFFSSFPLPLATLPSLLFVPCLWVLLEYARSHLLTGFPWALLGYSQYLNLTIIQISDITGAWGVSFLVMMVNIGIYLFTVYRLPFTGSHLLSNGTRYTEAGTRKISLFCIGMLIAALGYGFFRLHQDRQEGKLKVSVIQANIPQELKWEAHARNFILERYARLSQEAALEKPDLIAWPEAAAPGLLGQDKEVFESISSLAKDSKTPLIIGAVRREEEKYFNSALFINGSGEIRQRYDKLHLVPFGEYIPLKKFLPFLETIVPIGDIDRGREYTVFKIKDASFAVLICFEDVFPELSRRFVKEGAGFLVNITNDAWYKYTSAPFQHLMPSVFRAIENRVFLVRAANTGVSGFIAPTGRIISLVRDGRQEAIFVEGYRTTEIGVAKKHFSLYTKYGDVFVILCFVLAIYFVMTKDKIQNSK